MAELHALEKLDGHINLQSGSKINLLDPQPDQIYIEDIARGLANNGHFGGQTPKFFSIAEHCIMVYNLCYQDIREKSYLAKLALLHDASEAYLGDMLKPLKVNLPEFVEIEDRMMKAICERFGLYYEDLPNIKPYDKLSQQIEFHAFFNGGDPGVKYNIEYYSPQVAKVEFMQAAHELNIS